MFFGLSFLWHPFFYVAVTLFGGWLVLYAVVTVAALGRISLRGVLNLFVLEIKRKER